MRQLILVIVAALLSMTPPASAWGFDVHRFIVDRAIDLLPAEIRPFYDKHRTVVVEHTIDPDLWRNAGFEEEPPRHFLDMDAYGSYPFLELPRDYEAAVRKFGRQFVEKNGLVPWRTAEMYGKLTAAFRAVKQGTTGFTLDDVKFFSSVVAHYVADAHVPFHGVLNYDGQMTGQHGIHSRFETELFRRYAEKITLKPPPVSPVTTPRDFIFDTLLVSVPLVDPVLKADRRAVAGREEYDDEYFDRLFAEVQPILERRMADAIAGVASVIVGAWRQGGEPALLPDPPRVNRKVRRPAR
ncbi:MAG: hypothetical protein LC804_12770 [Acidobacteria bacterium]|nr:hypothetical protein [Acidobacteriota bacterium]